MARVEKCSACCERFGVPYAGADAFGVHQAMHKVLSKMRALEEGLLTPDFRHIEHAEDSVPMTYEIIRTFMQPVVVKPVGLGSKIGSSIVGGIRVCSERSPRTI
jgi:D-alanine-D-alanine ligase-like ATP-grasp enzyme